MEILIVIALTQYLAPTACRARSGVIQNNAARFLRMKKTAPSKNRRAAFFFKQ
jgi:hypothetical protein